MNPTNRSQFQFGDVVIIIDEKGRKQLGRLEPERRFQVVSGYFDAEDIVTRPNGATIPTSKGRQVEVHRATLEEYILLMKRAATIIPPKDISAILFWADVEPGMVVAEAGIGSGGLTLGLLRAVGPAGKVVSCELREDHAARALKNIETWNPDFLKAHEIVYGDIREPRLDEASVDRLILDIPDPWNAVDACARALVTGGFFLSYVPGIRQIDKLVMQLSRHPDFGPIEVCEVILRPWVADEVRLRPELRMVGHTGFIARCRKRLRPEEKATEPDSEPESEDLATESR